MAWVNVGRKEWKRLCAAEPVTDVTAELEEATKAAFGGLLHPDAKVIMARAEKFRKLREEIARAKKEGMDIDEAVRYMIGHDGKQMPKDDIGENGAKFTEADHTKERQDKALWAKSKKTAEKVLKPVYDAVIETATKEEKSASKGYMESAQTVSGLHCVVAESAAIQIQRKEGRSGVLVI